MPEIVPVALSSRRAASATSDPETMAERRYTLSVLCPVSFIATEREMPFDSKLRTAVRRRSCGDRGTPRHDPALAFKVAGQLVLGFDQSRGARKAPPLRPAPPDRPRNA